jgi:hypothetical protein
MKRLSCVFLMVVAACGGSDPDNPDASATPDATRVDAAPPDAEPIPMEGIVIIAEQQLGKDASSTVDVTINEGALLGGPMTTSGDCGFYALTAPPTLSAGVLTVTGTSVEVTATPDGTTPPVQYDTTPEDLPLNLFDQNATLTVAADGATVPAFSGTVVTPGDLLNVTLPGSFSRAAPPTITWTAGGADEIWVWMIAIPSGILWCRTEDTGSYTVPTAAAALIPNSAAQGLALLWRTNATPVRAGAWDIAITAATAQGTDTIPIEP